MSVPSAPIVVGIDGGGSHVNAIAIVGDEIIFRGHGGAGNPLATDEVTLIQSYRDALSGCPQPDRVGACVAGAGSQAGRDILLNLLGKILPGVPLAVGADYLAAVHSAEGYDLWVISGTGSLVVSRVEGAVATSGGRGWLLGDHGSAARLGRALLESYVEDPEADITLAAEVDAIAGDSGWLALVRQAQSRPAPAEWLGRFAPILTARAEAGEGWANDLVDAQMSSLATTSAHHVRRHFGCVERLRVCLVGGVWESTVVLESFGFHFRALVGAVEFCTPRMEPAVGAAIFAGTR